MNYNTAKAVMLSIRPKWVEKIANGEKTVEVRKTAPRDIKVPFKCYIYCTKAKYAHEDFFVIGAGTKNCRSFYGGGKVVGEFLCDKIDRYLVVGSSRSDRKYMAVGADFIPKEINRRKLALTKEEIESYGKGRELYGWHITELRIYDEPKQLNEFFRECARGTWDFCRYCNHGIPGASNAEEPCGNRLKEPPVSWCYVEEVS